MAGVRVRREQLVGGDHGVAEAAQEPVERVRGADSDYVAGGVVDDRVDGPPGLGGGEPRQVTRRAATGGQAQRGAEQGSVTLPAGSN